MDVRHRRLTVSKIFVVVLTLCMFQSSMVYAQPAKYTIGGIVHTWAQDQGQDDYGYSIFDAVEAAVVTLESKTDTLHTTTDLHGRFLFRKFTSRYFKVRVECLGYDTWEQSFDADTLVGFYATIRVLLEQKKEALKAAVVKDEAPVFEIIGDTLKYNVAATQQIADDDMLHDVLGRLPGISVENNLVKIMDEQVARIYIDGKLVFGDSVGDPLRYLAGSQVLSFKVYDQMTREERFGLAPKGSKKERVINVLTRDKIKSALIAQAIAGYGRNIESLGSEMDNRYTAGITGNLFSEMTLLSANVYLNNIGRNNEYSAVSNISSIPSSYSRLGYAGAKLVKKFRDPETGEILSASYSYGNTKQISESSSTRSYLPDENWNTRTYIQNTRNLSRKDAHNVSLNFINTTKYFPDLDLSFSAAGNNLNSVSGMENIVDGVRDGYSQLLTEKGDDYKWHSELSKSLSFGSGFYLGLDASLSGGSSHGGVLQQDTSIVSSAVTSFVSEPQGKNLNADVSLRLSKKLSDGKWDIRNTLNYVHRDESLHKLRYSDAIAEANLDSLTSDIHTYKYDTYSWLVGLHSGFLGNVSANMAVKAQYDRQRRDVLLPDKFKGGKDWFSVIPHVSLVFKNGVVSQTNVSLMATPMLPSFEQIRSDFNTVNPMYISRGNPDLQKATNYEMNVLGVYMLGKSHFLKVSLKASYMSDKITQKTQYIAENTTVDGFQLPKGATFSTYGNVDGSVAVRSFLGWSTRIKPLKLNVNGTLGYDFARDPSYIEEKLNVAHRHDPYMFLYVTTNFSRRYVMELRSNTNLSVVLNSRYSDVSYLDQKVSLFSKNKITDWMFVNAQYTFVMRSPFHDAGVGLQDHMLNAIVGFALKKSGVEINLSCYDILNRTSSFKTTVVGNYTQTSFNPDFGRIWMVTAVWRFNSTKKGRGKVNFGFNSPTLGREYEDTRKIIDLHR